MDTPRKLAPALVLWLLGAAPALLADGMVVPQTFHAKVEIPGQQALISYADGVEHLVIETSFQGEGTNFAWVVPLPATPGVEAVSEHFFDGVRKMFQPRLIHPVHLYGGGILFVCGIAWLCRRAYLDEARFWTDFPICLALAAGMRMATSSYFLASIALGLALCCRFFARTTEASGFFLLWSLVGGLVMTFPPAQLFGGMIKTLGDDAAPPHFVPADAGRVLGVQRAGVFDSTIVQSSQPRALVNWLRTNNYNPSPSAEDAIAEYVRRKWVFVASKIHIDANNSGVAALHPLAFTFLTKTPVYPMRLTAVDNNACTVDLYVFGPGRAAAPHYHVQRCDRVAANWNPAEAKFHAWLRDDGSEILDQIGPASVGTKLNRTLTPAQMLTDTEITWGGFHQKGAFVYSTSAAFTTALNIAVTLATLGALTLGASRGGWNVTDKRIRRWRMRLIGAAFVLGATLFFLLPKVEIVPDNTPSDAWSQQ